MELFGTHCPKISPFSFTAITSGGVHRQKWRCAPTPLGCAVKWGRKENLPRSRPPSRPIGLFGDLCPLQWPPLGGFHSCAAAGPLLGPTPVRTGCAATARGACDSPLSHRPFDLFEAFRIGAVSARLQGLVGHAEGGPLDPLVWLKARLPGSRHSPTSGSVSCPGLELLLGSAPGVPSG